MEGNWHGRTMGAQMLSGNPAQKEWVGYSDENIHHIPFPYPWLTSGTDSVALLENSLNELRQKGIDLSLDIAGFMVETFQGWGAVFYPKEYIQAIEQVCKKHNILLAFDEMQSGFGRTGKNLDISIMKLIPILYAVEKVWVEACLYQVL